MASRILSVREHARLDTEMVPAATLHQLSQTLARLGVPVSLQPLGDGRQQLRLGDHVGVLALPCGFQLEILPSHIWPETNLATSRHLLQRMIQVALALPNRAVGWGQLQCVDIPLPEWLGQQFLLALHQLLRLGLGRDYQSQDCVQSFLRGRLRVEAQLRLPLGSAPRFALRHAQLDFAHPANRLLRRTLEVVARSPLAEDSQHLAGVLRQRLREIAPSQDVAADLRRWPSGRLWQHYRPVRPWCELILGARAPLAVAGEWAGLSLLFSMPRLFERYVAVCLRRQLLPGAHLQEQPAHEHLCQQAGQSRFRLRPDLLLSCGGRRWVLDTKWKRPGLQGIAAQDGYQLLAYGLRYLGGEGEVVLIYPRSAQLEQAPPPLEFSAQLRLWILPFDLARGTLLRPPELELPLAY